jgi:hypothetical protein
MICKNIQRFHQNGPAKLTNPPTTLNISFIFRFGLMFVGKIWQYVYTSIERSLANSVEYNLPKKIYRSNFKQNLHMDVLEMVNLLVGSLKNHTMGQKS